MYEEKCTLLLFYLFLLFYTCFFLILPSFLFGDKNLKYQISESQSSWRDSVYVCASSTPLEVIRVFNVCHKESEQL